MRVLMISLDKTLLGADYSGDAVERHKEYAQRAGHLDIIVFSKRGLAKKEIDSNLAIYPTNSLTKLNYVRDAFKIAKEIIKQNKIDLVVTQTPFFTAWVGWEVKKIFKIPLLIHFHGDFWQNKYWLNERWLINRLLFRLSKKTVKRADGLRVVSSGIKNKLVASGIDSDKIRIIPTPIDIEKFYFYDTKEVEKLRKTYENKKVIINVGRKDKAKDYPTLEKAISLIKKKRDDIIFLQIGAKTNKFKQSELIKYYPASDVYVSSSSHESFGKVLIEAMAAGLPIVATATTGSKEIIKDGKNGFLVPVGNAEALAEKVLFLLDHLEEANEMRKQGQITAQKFGKEKTIQKIINFWQELCVS